jgi:hypothetical protein
MECEVNPLVQYVCEVSECEMLRRITLTEKMCCYSEGA